MSRIDSSVFLGNLSAFRRYFLVALLITTALSSLIFVGSLVALKALEAERLQYGQLLIDQTRTEIETRALVIQGLARQIALMNDTRRIFPLNDTSSFTLYELGRELSQMTNVGEMLDNITLVFIDEGIVIQSNVFSYRAPAFYEHAISFGDMDYSTFVEYIRGSTESSFYSFIDNAQVSNNGFPITMIQVFPFDPVRRQIAGAVMIHVNPWMFFRGVDARLVGEDGAFQVFDEGGRLIYANSSRGIPAVIETRLLKIESRSETVGWRFVALVPADALMETVSRFRTVSLIILFSLIGLLTAISFYAANSQAKLANFNRELEQDIEDHREILRGAFLSQLLSGKIPTDSEIDDYIEYVSLDDFRGDQYILTLLRLEIAGQDYDSGSLSALALERISIIKELSLGIPGKLCIQGIQNDLIAILRSTTGDNQDLNLPKQLVDLKNRFSKSPEIRLRISVSRPFVRLLSAPLAFIQTSALLRSGPATSAIQLVGGEQKNTGPAGFYYPIEVEMHLLTLIRIGEAEEAIDTFDQVRRHNTNISQDGLSLLRLQIIGTLHKAINMAPTEGKNSDLSRDTVKLWEASSLDTLFNSLPNIVQRIAAIMNEGRVDSDRLLVGKTAAYLEENYSDAMLSLDTIADFFEVNKKTLSRLYKKGTSQNLSTALEQIRLAKAFTLVVETKRSIETISKDTGYLNYNTFHKAFKRRFGRSPGAFRTDSSSSTSKPHYQS